jgi:hypothetical protein
MANLPIFDPQLAIVRIAEQVPALNSVKGAADFGAAGANGVKQLPSAFVVPLAETPGEQQLASMATQQSVRALFGVIFAAQNLRDARGEKALDSIIALRTAVFTAVYGWQPSADFDPCEFAGGRILQLDNQVLWWQDDFVTQSIIRSE